MLNSINKSSVETPAERAILVGLITQEQNERKAKEYIEELAFLADTAGAVVVRHFFQHLDYANKKTFVGTGKLEEIQKYVEENDIQLAIFDDELSPSQLRNIENELKVKVLDRTTLILDIFAKRARTSIAKTQVELAQYQYMLPRLTRLWTHLERQRGGIGMRGPGETQIETDRRIILDKISLLKEKLRSIDKQKMLQRKNRESLVRVALVGYTNVGKSTLMKIMVGVWDATDGEVAVPKNIGFLPEQNPLYEDMYVREYLRFFVELRLQAMRRLGKKEIGEIVEELIERVGLTTEANKRVGQLSKGYKQRVGLAQAMIGDPELLILDEPTTGLDPNQLEDIRALIRNLANPVSNSDAIASDMPNNGRSVILSTHILQEVKQMCTRVIIINHGEIKVNKPISEIEDLEQTFREATTSDIQ